MKDFNATHYFRGNRSFLKICHILSHKVSTHLRISILLVVQSDYNVIKLEINNKKNPSNILTFLKFQNNSWVTDDIMETRN